MPENSEQKDTGSLLAKLLGGAAGVTIDEAAKVPAVAQIPLSIITELGIEPYDELTHGLPIDTKTWLRARKIRKAMGAPSVPITRGQYHSAFTPQAADALNWLSEKFPSIFGYEYHMPEIFAESKNIPAIAHEMGHTVRSPIGKLSLMSPLLHPVALLGGIGAALSESETAQAAAPYIAGAGTIPTLLEEGRASAHALRGIGKAEGTRAALSAAGRLAPAFGTYAAGAIPTIMAPVVAKIIKDYIDKKMDHKKEASKQPKPIPVKTEGKLRASPSRAWATEGPRPKSSRPGKATSTSIKLPSKRKFYRDMQRQMSPGKGQRLSVKEAAAESVASGILGSLAIGTALMPVKNLIAHVLLNTKASPKRIRDFVENIGDEYLKAGFRHALVGKRVSSSGAAGIISGTAGGAAPMMMYNQGHEYGKKVYNTIKGLPGLDPKSPFKILRLADKTAKGLTASAPYTGILGGAGYGYATGKTKKEPLPLKSIAAGAMTGGLLGKGAKKIVPQAPPMKQLGWVRKKIVDPALEGSESRIGKLLDKMAK